MTKDEMNIWEGKEGLECLFGYECKNIKCEDNFILDYNF